MTNIVPFIVIKKGDTATVSRRSWVKVLNETVVEQKVTNGTALLKFGSTCAIECGGTVTVIGEMDVLSVLVRYTNKQGNKPFGTDAPSGVIFKISKDDFFRMTAEHKVISEENQREQVARILKAEKQGQRKRATRILETEKQVMSN